MLTSCSTRVVTALSKTHAGLKDWFFLTDEGISIKMIKIIWKACIAHTIETRGLDGYLYTHIHSSNNKYGRNNANVYKQIILG